MSPQELLALSAVFGGVALGFRRELVHVLSGLVEWEGERGRLTIGHPGSLAVLGVSALALAYFGGITGIAILGGGRSTGMPAAETPDMPNTPDIDVIVDDTSTWRVTFSTFVGSGADTQDSISVTVLRSAAADTLFHAVSGTQTADTISDNTDLKADTTYRVLGRQKGAAGGWSVADTLEVTNTVAALTVLFHSDWSTCTGMGAEFEDCYIDADKDDPWSAPKGDWETDAAVVDSAFWPDGLVNSLQIWHIGTGSGTGVRIQQNYVIPLYTEGDTIAYRIYFMNVLPDDHDSDGTSHASQDAIGGTNTNWEFNITDVSATEWAVSFSLGGAAAGGGFGHREWTLAEDCVTGPACRLDKHEVYRFEWMLAHHPTADSVDIAIRLYDDEGTLIAGEDEWYDQDDGTPSSETVWHAFRDYDFRDAWQVGTNGFGNQGSGGYVTWYWAGAAVCTTWCGAYPIGGVEN